MSMVRVTPAVDSDISAMYVNIKNIIGTIQYELQDGPICAIIIGVTMDGELESITVRESMDELLDAIDKANRN
jgi:hypothetical protein